MAFTYFFRDLQSLNLAVDLLLPATMGKAKIKIWDAGCASGQEPYSLAILLAEKMGAFSFRNLEITASDIDISQQFQQFISQGAYSRSELSRIPPLLLKKYFTLLDSGDQYQISEQLRKRIKYIRHDLLSLVPPVNGVSLIVCKNVLLHFDESKRTEVLKMFYHSLENKGLIVMEHTQKMPSSLKNLFKEEYGNAQIYRKI